MISLLIFMVLWGNPHGRSDSAYGNTTEVTNFTSMASCEKAAQEVMKGNRPYSGVIIQARCVQK